MNNLRGDLEITLREVSTSAGHYTFTAPKNYLAYVRRTDEKILLQDEIKRAYLDNELPIRPGDKHKKILDLGCGLGTHTVFLHKLFADHQIFAIDVSNEFTTYCSQSIGNQKNLIIQSVAFEDYPSNRFDFILASHVLQYIRTPLRQFLRKIVSSLTRNGQAWIVLQEEKGLNQMISNALPLLRNPSPFFKDWFTHQRIRNELAQLNVSVASGVIESKFKAVDSEIYSEDDLHFLSFVFLQNLDKYPRSDVDELIRVQSPLALNGRITHLVGISKICRLS